MKKYFKKENWLVITLIVLLVIAVLYLTIDKLSTAQAEKKQAEMESIAQQGIVVGYEQAVLQLMQQAATCQGPVPITYQNVTLNVIAIECIQQAQDQQQAQTAQ